MSIRIGINGLGRMGLLGLRTGWENPAYDIVHVNEVAGNSATMTHLLEFDSVHGRWTRDYSFDDQSISIDGKHLGFSSEKNPADVDWVGKGIDLVIDCTGKFKTEATLQPYFDQGVKKVLVSAPVPSSSASASASASASPG